VKKISMNLTFIRDALAPRHVEYLLIPSRLDPQYPSQIGSLLFEWPLDSVQFIADNWFHRGLTIEGYLSPRPCLGKLAEQYFEPYSERSVRKVLETLEFGFRVWPDNNGLFILSDKLNADAFRNRLACPELDEAIRAATHAGAQRRSRRLAEGQRGTA
jgi:hypothetical protein